MENSRNIMMRNDQKSLKKSSSFVWSLRDFSLLLEIAFQSYGFFSTEKIWNTLKNFSVANIKLLMHTIIKNVKLSSWKKSSPFNKVLYYFTGVQQRHQQLNKMESCSTWQFDRRQLDFEMSMSRGSIPFFEYHGVDPGAYYGMPYKQVWSTHLYWQHSSRISLFPNSQEIHC